MQLPVMRSVVTSIGVLGAVAEGGSLRYVLHLASNVDLLKALRESGLEIDAADEGENRSVLQQAEIQLKDYFNGKIKNFDLPVKARGTLFQKRVWKAISEIPYGQTLSYRELAVRAGHPQAVRAVGSACGANPVPVIIPCHRVIRADGAIGKFALGSAAKHRMLELELEQVRTREFAAI